MTGSSTEYMRRKLFASRVIDDWKDFPQNKVNASSLNVLSGQWHDIQLTN